jgi:hypothetical protein
MRRVLPLIPVLLTLWPAVPGAQDAAGERLRRAQQVIVSTLDPALPGVPLEEWLRSIVGSSARLEWTSGSCAGLRDRNNPAVPLCGIVSAGNADVGVTMGVLIGEYVQGRRVDRWAVPRFDMAFVRRGGKVVAVERLSELPRVLTLPTAEWPVHDVALLSASCVPERPAPNEQVTCALALSNRGGAPALARVFVDVQPDRSLGGGGGAIGLGAHESGTVRLTFRWPAETNATVTAGIELTDRTPYHRVNERGAITLTRGEDLDVPGLLLGYVDDDHAPQLIVSARVAAERTTRTIDVPVDASVRTLLLSVESVPGVTVAVVRPGGARAADTDTDVSRAELKTMDLVRQTPASLRRYTIADPQPGTWQIAVTGEPAAEAPSVSVRASGVSAIAFDQFEFVRKQEGVHGGYFPIDGMPLAEAPATATARLSDGVTDAAFRLVDEAGATLRTITLRKGDPETAADDWLGTFDLPAVPFHVVMQTAGGAGVRIQRQHPGTFRAQSVALFFEYGRVPVAAAGASKRFAVALTNVGREAAAFTLDVRTSVGDIVDLSHLPVSVEAGSSVMVPFTLAVPATADRLLGIELRMTATNAADPSLGNSTGARVEIAREGDGDNDFIEDARDNCRDVPNADQLDMNRNGIGDACDPSAGGQIAIRSISPQSGAAGTVVRIAGTGFSAAGPYIVLFNGRPVEAALTQPTELTMTVPPDVPAGPALLIVGADAGFAMSPVPFIVRPAARRQ